MQAKLVHSLLAAVCLGAASAEAAPWLTDLRAGMAQAKDRDKLVLVNFTGSDWCGWCIKLRKEVFSQPEFETFADKNLVLVEVDFPRQKELSAEQQKANEALAERFNITGFPTIVVFDSAGRRLGTTGYIPGGTKAFLSVLRQLQDPKAALKSDAPEVPASPLFGGAPTQPPPRYAELTLRGISGPAGKRMALINNQTLGVGESGRVKLGDGVTIVRCLEIGEKSAIVMVDGEKERRELKLRVGL